MAFLEHLGELRNRLVKAVVVTFVLAIVCFFFAADIINFLKAQLLPRVQTGLFEEGPQGLYSFTPGEQLWQELKVAIICGISMSIPVIVYQLWAFISPGLYEKERKVVVPLILAAILFFLAGVAFCFFVVLPFALTFLLSYGASHTTTLLGLSHFVSFVMFFVMAFGLIFELPVLLFFLAKVGVLTSKPLRKFRRFAILGCFIVAALLTPTPDIVNQCLMAVPMWGLYELGILGVVHVEKTRAKAAALAAAEEEAERAAQAKTRAAQGVVDAGEGGS